MSRSCSIRGLAPGGLAKVVQVEWFGDQAVKVTFEDSAAQVRNRLVFRAFGDNILGFAPALSYTEAEFDLMFERLEQTLDDVLAEPEVRAALKVKAAKDEVKGDVKTHIAA